MKKFSVTGIELIHRDYCSAIAYHCFSTGFHEQNETDTRSNEQSVEIEGWNLILFQHGENDEWVIWFWDDEGDERYFGEFWLILTEEKRAEAERAFQQIAEFLRRSVEKVGISPPFMLEAPLYEIIGGFLEEKL